MIFGLVTIGLGTLASSYLGWLASRQRRRRISQLEEFDVGDMNRIVTALNRTQILNARAALLASATAALAAVRMGDKRCWTYDRGEQPGLPAIECVRHRGIKRNADDQVERKRQRQRGR